MTPDDGISVPAFPWPDGDRAVRAAISLTFDDARVSQIDCGVPILDTHGVRATFYVSPSMVKARLAGWRKAVAAGHEIGNHTMTHPCTGNFLFARSNALEDYTLERIEQEIIAANDAIREMLGVTPVTFAYPCGNKHVGSGMSAQSYVPVVARHFLVGRGWLDPRHNAPDVCDLARVCGCAIDRLSFDDVKVLIDAAVAEGGWLVLAGHETGIAGRQTVLAETLEAICEYARDPANGIWIDTVAEVGRYIQRTRGT